MTGMACGKETSVPSMPKPATATSVEEDSHDHTWDAPDYVNETDDTEPNNGKEGPVKLRETQNGMWPYILTVVIYI